MPDHPTPYNELEGLPKRMQVGIEAARAWQKDNPQLPKQPRAADARAHDDRPIDGGDARSADPADDDVEDVSDSSSKLSRKRRNKQPVVKPDPLVDRIDTAFTTRLSEWHKATLRQAAAINRAFQLEPDTQAGIIAAALDAYFKKHNFPRNMPE